MDHWAKLNWKKICSLVYSRGRLCYIRIESQGILIKWKQKTKTKILCIVAQNLTNDTKISISYSRSHWHYAILVGQSTRIVFFFFRIPMAKLFDRFFSREIARAETAIARDNRYDNSTRETLKFFSSSNNSLHCDIYLFFFRIFCFHVYLCYNSRSSYRYQFIIKKFFSIFLYSMLNDPEEGVHLTRSRWRHLSNLSWITLTAQRNQI